MSTVTVTLRITFEDILGPGETDEIAEKLDRHFESLLDFGFLDRFGTIYDYDLSASYNADDDP